MIASRSNILLDTSHIPGARKEEADALSRWSGDHATARPSGFTRESRIHFSLKISGLSRSIRPCIPQEPRADGGRHALPREPWVANSLALTPFHCAL